MKFIINLVFIITSTFPLTLIAKENAEILGKLPFVNDLKISPNGEKIALIQNIKGKYHIVVRELGKPKVKPVVFGLGSAKIRSLDWGNDNNVIFWATIPYYSKGDYETFTMRRVGFLNVENNEAIWPFNKGKRKLSISAPTIVNKLIKEPNHILASYYGDLFKVRLSDGKKEKIKTDFQSSGWVTNTLGEIVAYSQYSKTKSEFTEMLSTGETSEFKQLSSIITSDGKSEKNKFKGNIQFVSADKKSIFHTKRTDKDVLNLIKATVNDLTVSDDKVYSGNGKFDVKGIVKDVHTSQMVGVKFVKDFQEYEYFDGALKQVYADLKATFPDSEVSLTSYTVNRQKFIAKISSKEYPLEYFYYDQKEGQLVKIADGYPEIKTLALGNVSTFNYDASDGVSISGYFTRPADKEGTKLPLIVLPHGGPEARDNMSFDWLRQFFASEGYAVFQSNYRGSTGYGKVFTEAGYGEWGKRMQQDIDDGVDKLIKDELVDKEKICVVGASYGGYVALFSATARHDKYKCAVSFAGVSNLDDMFYHAKEQLGGFDYWERSIGKRVDNNTLLKYSPLSLVTEKTRPILMFHGTKDTVVPVFQSEKMFKKLEEAKIKGAQYIEFDGGDHWISEQKFRIEFLQKSLTFIKENI